MNRILQSPQFGHDRAYILACGQKEDHVIFLDHGIAIRNDRAVTAKYCGNTGFYTGREQMIEPVELLIDQWPVGIRLNCNQLRFAIGEVQDLEGTGVTCNSLFPGGAVRTAFVPEKMHSNPRLLDADIMRALALVALSGIPLVFVIRESPPRNAPRGLRDAFTGLEPDEQADVITFLEHL